MMIEVSGNSTLRVGHTVTLELPSPEATDGDGESDNKYDKFEKYNYEEFNKISFGDLYDNSYSTYIFSIWKERQ